MKAKSIILSILLLHIIFSLSVSSASAQKVYRIPEPETVLSTLRENHPRLLLNDTGLERLKEQMKTDPVLKGYVNNVIDAADEICMKPVLSYKVREGYRLMSVSRQCMDRMYTLGMAWRLTGREKYAVKAEKDLLAVTSFENWTPSLVVIYPLQEKHKRFEEKNGRPPYSFLDVSETCHAVGIGYDWFYNFLSGESREKIKSSLIRNGLELGVMAYTGKGTESGSKDAWTTYNHNWNMVCNGGLIVGALAIAETDPEYARLIIPSAVKSLPYALTTYGPDGAWPEGPSYWGYATRYTAFGLAALESALGTDFGLSDIRGLKDTGLFPLYTTGPTGLYLNFADSAENNSRKSVPCLFWLAGKYGSRFLSDSEHFMINRHGADALHLVWYVPPSHENPVTPDLDRYFQGPVDIAVFRSGWKDSNELFVGVKAGDNTFNHSNLDLGNFEMDALGVRWARDLGADNYSLPGYFDFYYLTKNRGGQRWNYYRNNSLSHNVPLLNGESQDELAKARFISFDSKPSSAHVLIDLSEAYKSCSRRTVRGVAVVENRRAVLVQDEFELAGQCDIAWGMTTDADIKLAGNTAELTQDGKKLTANILSPLNAEFSIESAEQKPPQKTNKGVRRLMIHLKNQNGKVLVAVLLSPHWKDGITAGGIKIKPLEEWK